MIWIALPMYNEEKDIEPYLTKVKAEMKKIKADYKVLILNDGSTDNSISIVKKLTKNMPILLIHHKVNQGLGITMKDLFAEVIKRTKDDDIIVTMDSDNSHDPKYIKPISDLVKTGRFDVVIASRYAPGGKEVGLSLFRSFLSRGLGTLLKIVFPVKGLRDYGIGYRAYDAKVLKAANEKYGASFIEATGFPGMAEILLKLRRLKKLRVAEVPLTLRYDLKKGDSKIKIGKTIIEYLRVLTRERFRFF
tara:strand:+ start:33970 stop:34713 length:744 start_codon:yes stop_codon:yes gene_type:complete